PAAGASLLHPHSQILATSQLPQVLEGEAVRFAQHSTGHSARCLLCDLLEVERASDRLVFETADFVAVSPYASRFPFELLLIPTSCSPDLRTTEPERFAGALQLAMGRLRACLADPPTNVWIHCAPTGSWSGLFHWHAHVVPRLTVEGGWEQGYGVPVNAVAPEEAARLLRG
ncbi:MAG: galactose-1-phosphate uridylyltransferase, partial [Cyanobacteria bacterium REEB65]|nr:galactose-1-phosphate uridylyltransferase [Cyanobacteria bacterium REEB65]